MTYLLTEILDISRQNQQEDDLSPWLSNKLNNFIMNDRFLDERELVYLGDYIISDLYNYKAQTGVGTAVIGMSGGVDSALTAALLKRAGWRVIGVTMPIEQDPIETERGIEACKALDIEHMNIDLFGALGEVAGILDERIQKNADKARRIRRGNIKARLRMIALYNLAAREGGLVASTDNYSELAVGFWTLHGDVGDISPIQSLTKSWEVPMLAKLFGVPEEIWRAMPTDGLGVDDGDEAQFGFSYLELDIMLLSLGDLVMDGFIDDRLHGDFNRTNLLDTLNIMTEGTIVDKRAEEILDGLLARMGSTWFKRMNPVNIQHSIEPRRYRALAQIDRDLFQPNVVKGV